ncbi:hypothetical protein [Marinomonas hwangdonensis]|uniref:hypothetical protein n=1 Tax=Marinomonas hwangdonensis TaxID=1053647 RepID=UPI0011CDFE73|nr:hypothetical protein [Marinomonas hwangdonensis]
MSVSLLSSYIPHSWPQASPLAGGTSSPQNQPTSTSVKLSTQGKQLSTLATSDASRLQNSNTENKEGDESVQLTSSTGRLHRSDGLQREEVAAIYRSIERLT